LTLKVVEKRNNALSAWPGAQLDISGCMELSHLPQPNKSETLNIFLKIELPQ